MIDNSDAWLKRAAEMLEKSGIGGYGLGSESAQFATSMLTAFYGAESPQLKAFQAVFEGIKKTATAPANLDHNLHLHARGVIRNTVAEINAGLIVRLRTIIAGEMLGELIRLAKELVAEGTEEAKNTAAVLSAAAFEGLIRRMGKEFAGVADRPKLEQVIGALKTADVLKGGQIATAQSYLKFRNDSLHADWKNVDRSQVDSCLAFSESLLLKQFAG